MDTDIRAKIDKILDMQIVQTSDIAVIKTYQKTHREKLDKLEVGQEKNTIYRNKSLGAITIIYIFVGIIGSLLAKKLLM